MYIMYRCDHPEVINPRPVESRVRIEQMASVSSLCKGQRVSSRRNDDSLDLAAPTALGQRPGDAPYVNPPCALRQQEGL